MRFEEKPFVIVEGPIKLPVLLKDGSIGNFKLHFFRYPKGDYYVLEKPILNTEGYVNVRIQSACFLAHIFKSQRCDCYEQLELSLSIINKQTGLIIYAVNHEGRGVGPLNHVRVYKKQDEGFDTVDSYIALGLPIDSRDYSEIKFILKKFKVKKVNLLTNNPQKINILKSMGFVVKRIPLIPKLSPYNQSQIKVKAKKLGHLYPEEYLKEE